MIDVSKFNKSHQVLHLAPTPGTRKAPNFGAFLIL
jgi:hypothetical protein